MSKRLNERFFLDLLGYIALTLVFMAMAIEAAYATGKRDPEAEAHADADATAKAYAGAEADADASATGGAADASANNALTFNSTTPDDITIRNTASANMPNLSSTAPCVLSWSAGLGIAGANIGGGKAKIDPECNIRETARTFAGLGEIELALTIACTSEVAKAALGDACGLSNNNVYIRVNEPIRYIERVTGGDTAAIHDVSEEAVETCTEANTRAFEACQQGK